MSSQASHEHAHAQVTASRGITDWATHRSDLCTTSCRNSVGESYMTSLMDWPVFRNQAAAGVGSGGVPGNSSWKVPMVIRCLAAGSAPSNRWCSVAWVCPEGLFIGG